MLREQDFVVVENHRGERPFRQLYINHHAGLNQRVDILGKYYSVEAGDIINVLEDLQVYLEKGQLDSLSEYDKKKYTGRKFEHYFQGRLRGIGISQHHSENLVIGIINRLALNVGVEGTDSWWEARTKLLNRLWDIIQ